VAPRALGLLGEAEQDPSRPEDRGGGTVQAGDDVGTGARWGVADESDDGSPRLTAVANADHHAVAKAIDELSRAACGGQSRGADLDIVEPAPTQLADQRRWPVGGVAHDP
jgi:hypothetical protein